MSDRINMSISGDSASDDIKTEIIRAALAATVYKSQGEIHTVAARNPKGKFKVQFSIFYSTVYGIWEEHQFQLV